MLPVIWLEEPICQQVHLVGGKAANLATVANQFRVPPGFVIPQPSVTQLVIREAYQRLGGRFGEEQPACCRAFIGHR